MTITIKELAALCAAEIIGSDPLQHIDSAANPDEAGSGQLTFISNAKYADKLPTSKASAVIVPKTLGAANAAANTCLLLVDDPELAFITCLQRLYPGKTLAHTVNARAEVAASASLGEQTQIDAFVSIGARSKLGRNCWIMAGCRIGDDVTIGDDCVLYPNVVLYDGVQLANHVMIHAGSVIGSDGFGYKFRNGKHIKFPQVGTVVIESDVEIGANTCIDRAALGETRIAAGTKIDNLVQIAHGVKIGEHSVICGQVGIGGSTVIKDHVMLISQCGVADHVTVGAQAMVLAQAGVTKDVADKEQVMGFPAMKRKEWLVEAAALRRLAGNQKAIDELVRLLPTLRQPDKEE